MLNDIHKYYRMISATALCISMLFLAGQIAAQPKVQHTAIDTDAFNDNAQHWYGIFDKQNVINPRPAHPRYKATDLVSIGDNILLYQKNNGGWPKNYDIMAELTDAQKDSLIRSKNQLHTTFDNGTTYTHIAALATIYNATLAEKYKDAMLKGVDFILAAQYPNGGWPQYYPLENKYSRHITFNDGAFVGIMLVLKNISDGDSAYVFIDNDRRLKVKNAYEKGLDCILKTQIRDNGKLTAWCQQHDEVTLQPAWARAFEPAGICNQESSGIVLFLMSISDPSKEVITAIEHAVKWFIDSRIFYTSVKTVSAPGTTTNFRVSYSDHIVVADSAAAPVWTRYYELKTHRPLFFNKDGKVVYSLAEVDRERRDGYAWYTYSPKKLLATYPVWLQKWAPQNDVLDIEPR